MYEEALNAIQKTAEGLRQENKVLKDKTIKLGKGQRGAMLTGPEAQQAVIKEKSEELSIPSELVSAEVSAATCLKLPQINTLKTALRYLRDEVARLQGREAQRQLDLPPLKFASALGQGGRWAFGIRRPGTLQQGHRFSDEGKSF